MSGAGIVEPFDVFEQQSGKFDAGVFVLPIKEFDLDSFPKGLDQIMVVQVTNEVVIAEHVE